MRNLPVYVLLDCSESMAGASVEAVQDGLGTLLSQLRRNPYALETVLLSVITFSNEARQLFPLTEIAAISLPTLSVRPGTALGEAFVLLRDCIRREVHKPTEEEKGDFRPLVFLITDGQPTDEWRDAVAKLAGIRPRPANIYVIGCGEDIDFGTLNSISDCVFHMKDMSPNLFSKLFVWMSASIQNSSEAISSFNENALTLPPPEGCVRMHADLLPIGGGARRRQVFLHVRCTETKRPFLLRYVLDDERGVYIARAVHVLEESFFPEGGNVQESVSADLLWGDLPCPYCGNPVWVHCGHCRQFFCALDQLPEQLFCPLCGCNLVLATEGGGEVESSLG